MIRIRSFSAQQPLPALDVTTGSNRIAAQEAAERARQYGSWADVQVNFNDGSRALRGNELRAWVALHFPECMTEPVKPARDYGPDGVTVVIACNDEGRVEPFVFERRSDADRYADSVRGFGSVNTALVYHGVEVLDEHAAQRVHFGVRKLHALAREEET